MHHLVEVPAGDQPELQIDRLWAAGAVGIEERPGLILAAFLQTPAPVELAIAMNGTVNEVADDEGLDAWREHARVHNAGPFAVRAPWHLMPVPEPGPEGARIDLVIDPLHSFGSGSHPSTRLALELMASCVATNDRVVDIGSGSGILSIGALLLGARHATAVDIDPAAAQTAKLNAQANDVHHNIDVRTATAAETSGDFDLCLINVTIDIHESIADTITANISTPHILVAGVLVGEQEARVATAYRRPVVDHCRDGEWAALLLGAHNIAAIDRVASNPTQ